jgi:hypothetical protein
MDGLTIERVGEQGADALREFLRRSADTVIFHTPEWHAVVRATYGHMCDYWVARDGAAIVGVFPVVAMRHPLLGTKMVAMPYQYYCGVPIAADTRVQIELVQHAIARAREAGARYLEIRHHAAAPFLEGLGFVALDSQLVTTTAPLEGLTLKQIFRGHRQVVGYALKRGVRIVEGQELADLQAFRALYRAEGRQQGSPQAGWRYFENLHRHVRAHSRLLLAVASDQCLGGLLTLDDGRTVFLRSTACNTPAARKLHVSKALMWRAMADAAARGCRQFNFGISWSGNRGLIAFKEGWNGSTLPVHVYIYPIRSRPPAPGRYFESFGLAKAMWRHLPLPVLDRLGHHVTRWVG